MTEWIIIVVAGILGGMLNALAGGGSFITFPALILAGVPPILANATSTAALLPGYIASTWRFKRDIEFPAGLSCAAMVIVTLSGGSLGAGVLLHTSEQVFSTLIPWLILFATILFVVGPRVNDSRIHSLQRSTNSRSGLCLRQPLAIFCLFAVCVYGGYFNGGLGIILLAVLGLMGQTNLLGMNGLKNLVSSFLTAIAVVVYAIGGVIVSKQFLVMGAAAIVGGYFDAALAYRISKQALQVIIVSVGLFMSASFFLMKL